MSTTAGVGPAAPGRRPDGPPTARPRWSTPSVPSGPRCAPSGPPYWTLIIAAVLGIGLGALLSAVAANHYATDPGIRIGWNPTDHSLRSLLIAQLAFAILGVMVVTGEYSTGLIRTSLAAVPRRTRMMAAKALVLTALALVAGEVISFVTFFVGQALLHGKAPSATIGDHNVLRAVVGAGLYLTLLALLGVALGVLLRHAAAAIGSVVAILLVLPAIAQALPSSWSQPVEKFWPTNAGTQVAVVIRDSHTLPAWAGFEVFALFVAVVLGWRSCCWSDGTPESGPAEEAAWRGRPTRPVPGWGARVGPGEWASRVPGWIGPAPPAHRHRPGEAPTGFRTLQLLADPQHFQKAERVSPVIPRRRAPPRVVGTHNRVPGALATDGLIRLNLVRLNLVVGVNHDVPVSVASPFERKRRPG